jgi:predicted esterase
VIEGPWRLQARPGATALAVTPGTRELGSGALLHVPQTDGPWPLVVLFHGAGSTARAGLGLLEAPKAVLLAPQSAGSTWDQIERGFGPDVTRLDGALRSVFATCSIDPARIVFGGFSDGASYALSLGLANGDLVTHIVAFSPGFVAAPEPDGRPRIFVTHGIADTVLPGRSLRPHRGPAAARRELRRHLRGVRRRARRRACAPGGRVVQRGPCRVTTIPETGGIASSSSSRE